MKVAHIILVHKNPHQVARLIQRLAHPDVHCWIHIDKKYDSPAFRNILAFKNVSFTGPNIRVDWGCFNTVEAMLMAMRIVCDAEEKYDYINFMSGQEYPLQQPDLFVKYLTANKEYEFIGNRPLEESRENILRFKKYHFNDYSFQGKQLFERVVNKILPDRKFPYPFEIKKGPQWMTITRNAAMYILEFVSANPRYVRYFQTVHIPDEFFFQTILYNSPFQDNLKNQIFHYADWLQKSRHPKTLTIEDFDKITANKLLFFARKFDTTVDAKILDLIDKEKLA